MISIDQQGTRDIELQALSMVGEDSRSWVYDFPIENQDSAANVDGLASLRIDSPQLSENFETSFVIDTQAPTLNFTTTAENGTVLGASAVTISVQVSEALASPPLLIATRAGVRDSAVSMTAGAVADSWTYDYQLSLIHI